MARGTEPELSGIEVDKTFSGLEFIFVACGIFISGKLKVHTVIAQSSAEISGASRFIIQIGNVSGICSFGIGGYQEIVVKISDESHSAGVKMGKPPCGFAVENFRWSSVG